MVTIEKHESDFIFEIKGMHKLWAFKSQLTIPTDHVINAHQDLEFLRNWWKGIRLLGTYVPSIITAGTFYNDGKKIFWDVSDAEKCIIIDLKDEWYNQLIIEVENPNEAINFLTK